MSVQTEPSILENGSGQFEVHLMDGSKITCQSREDADLVLDAVRRFFEGNTGRKLPIRTLDALERAGLNPNNSMLYRSVLHNLAPHITVPVSKLDKVKAVLDSNHIPYWIDEEVLSLDGKPEVAFVSLGHESDPEFIQSLLKGIM